MGMDSFSSIPILELPRFNAENSIAGKGNGFVHGAVFRSKKAGQKLGGTGRIELFIDILA